MASKVHIIRKILPAILVLLTRHSRYLPDIEWSSKSFVHNTFRAYEMVFWRREGIRPESATRCYVDENGKKVVRTELYTIEATLAYIETLVRNVFQFKLVRVTVPRFQLAHAGNPLGAMTPFISFAIALDTASTGTTTTSSPLTWSHTVTGSNPFLAVGSGISGTVSPTTTAVTYNSVSTTKARSDQGAGSVSGVTESSVWFLGSASTGSNTVSVTFSGGGNCVAGAVSYSGTQTTNTADAVNGTNGTTTGAKSFNVTTVKDNCWVFATGAIAGTTPAFSVPIQTSRWSITLVGVNSQVGQDTNGAKTPAGAVSMGWTTGGSGSAFRWALTGASFAPFLAATINFITYRPPWRS